MNHIQIRLAAMAGLAALALSSATAQQAPVAAGAAMKSEEIVLDVIVRDKKGKEVTDLGPDDFEVQDDGGKQQVKSFRRIDGREATAKGGAKIALDPMRQVRLVTLLFEGMGPTGRQFARTAGIDLIKTAQAQNVYYAVMTNDTRLNVLQHFTTDKDNLRKAIERATNGTNTEYAAESARIQEELQKQLATVKSDADSNAVVQSRMAQDMLDILQNATVSTDWSRSIVNAFVNVSRGSQKVPGRKTVIFFNEGLYIPTYLDAPFQSMIGAANRANVSVYSLDVRGVGAAGTGGARGSLSQAAALTRGAVSTAGGSVSTSEITATETAEEGMRGDSQSKLRELSDGTGGFLISDTNELRAPLRKINEEINGYYEMVYNPSIDNYDGKFRKIGVKLARSDVKVSGRSGYFALPTVSGLTEVMLPYEVPMLKALSTSPLPKDVEYKSAVVRFQQTPEHANAALVIDVPFKSLTMSENKAKNTFGMHVSLVALLKNATGEVLRKFDRDLPLEYPIDKMADAKTANFQYSENFAVPPGRYVVETAVTDRNGGKIGARKMTFVVAPKSAGVKISSLSLVRRFEPKAKNLSPDEPFQIQGGRVTPTLAGSIPSMKGGLLSLFFVVYPDPAIAEKPQALVEFLVDGKAVGGGVVELPAADPQGRIQYVMSSPVESMKPGTYEVHAVVKQGSSVADERTVVTIEEK